jgi:hypothetical protein
MVFLLWKLKSTIRPSSFNDLTQFQPLHRHPCIVKTRLFHRHPKKKGPDTSRVNELLEKPDLKRRFGKASLNDDNPLLLQKFYLVYQSDTI